MDTNTRNSHGLFDSPIRSKGQEIVFLTEEDIEMQLDAGAFVLSREEAIEAGFIDPDDLADVVTVQIRREVA